LELSTTVPEGEDRPRSTCRNCGYIHYENPSVLVSCILFREDRLLWIKRATEPYSGRWAFPGGFVERGETVEEATCRELYEETGLTLRPELLILNGVSSVPEMNQIYLSLVAPLPSMNFRATRECTEVKLAKEMDDHKTVSVSRVYVPNEYTVYLSTADREQFEGYENVDTNDVENAVWHFMCVARKDGVEKARAGLLKIGKEKAPQLSSQGKLSASQIATEMRKLIEAMPVGQVSQPIVQKNGIGVIMVCGKSNSGGAGMSRDEVGETILRQRFDTLARRYLRDLRRSSYVDVRM